MKLRRGGATGDHEHVPLQFTRVRLLLHVDAELDGTADELLRYGSGLGDAVFPACDRAVDVVGAQAGDMRRVRFLDWHPEALLHRRPLA